MIIAVNLRRSILLFLLFFLLNNGAAKAQDKSMLVCLEPTIVNIDEFNKLLEIGPKKFEIDKERIPEIDYIDSLLKINFQSEIDLVDSSFKLVDSCLQFMRIGSEGGASSYYIYSTGVTKDKKGKDVIEVFLHYRNVVPHNSEGKQKLGVSFYRLTNDRILVDPIIRLHTFKKTYDIPL